MTWNTLLRTTCSISLNNTLTMTNANKVRKPIPSYTYWDNFSFFKNHFDHNLRHLQKSDTPPPAAPFSPTSTNSQNYLTLPLPPFWNFSENLAPDSLWKLRGRGSHYVMEIFIYCFNTRESSSRLISFNFKNPFEKNLNLSKKRFENIIDTFYITFT